MLLQLRWFLLKLISMRIQVKCIEVNFGQIIRKFLGVIYEEEGERKKDLLYTRSAL